MSFRDDFPILQQQKNGVPITFLDSGATSQKPRQVIEAIEQCYQQYYANIHRGLYDFSEKTTAVYELARQKVADFIGAGSANNIVFTRNTTEGINLVAYGLTQDYFKPGDEIIISEMEHHANIVPWQVACQKTGAVLRVIPVTDSGELDMPQFERLLNDKTRLVAVAHVSNVLGTVNPVSDIVTKAKQHNINIPVLIDGAQAVPHMPVNVSELGADFYVFSGHKCYGPSGGSALYMTDEWMGRLPPYQTGGGMILEVTLDKTTYLTGPGRFEAGTPDIAGAIGLGAAMDYLNSADMHHVANTEQALIAYAVEQLESVGGVEMFGQPAQRAGAVSFTMKDIHPHDIATILNDVNVAVRAGHHCAMPLHQRFGLVSTVRASFGIYSNRHDVDHLVLGLDKVKQLFGVS